MVRSLLFFATVGCTAVACTNTGTPGIKAPQRGAPSTSMDSLAARITAATNYKEHGVVDKAAAIVDSILLKYPGQLNALNLKADLLKEQNQPAASLAALEKAYRLQPRDKESAYNLAYEYAEQKNRKALVLTDTLLKYDKTETVARAWYIKATYYNNTGNAAEALKNYDASTAADINFIDAYLDKGKLLFIQKNYSGALKTFATGQKVSPATADFYFWVAQTQEAMGNKADAKTNYERAYALDKEMNEAKVAADRL